MHALLTHPAIQVILAPFLIALLSAELLLRMRLSGLAIIAGFSVTVYLLSGFAYTPLTGARKIVWLGLGSVVLALPASLISSSLWRPLLALLAAVSAVWVTQRVLLQQPAEIALQWGAGAALYVGWQVYWMDRLHDAPVRAASAGMALGLGGGAALLVAGASLLGQYNFAIGAAVLAYLFIMFVSNSHLACGRSFTLPLALVTGLSAMLAVLTTKTPWYALLALAAIPLAAQLPVSERAPVWVQATLLSAATLALAFLAAYASWHIHGGSIF